MQVIAIFVSGVKRKLMAEEEKYEENNMNFECVYFKDGWTDLAQTLYGQCPTPKDSLQKKMG